MPSRNPARLEQLRGYVREAGVNDTHLETVEADVSTFDGAERVVSGILERHGRLDLSVASLGGWWRGPQLMDTTLDDWERVMRDNLQAHYAVARHVLPAMRTQRSGTHILIGGPGNVLYNPASTLITVAGTAQLTMAQILAQEAERFDARVYQLFIANILDRQRGGGTREGFITPDSVGEYALKLHLEHPDGAVQKLMPQPIPGFNL